MPVQRRTGFAKLPAFAGMTSLDASRPDELPFNIANNAVPARPLGRSLEPVSDAGGHHMATIDPYAAKEVYDPPMYAQAVKVSGAQTILYIAGQVAYTAEGGAAHAGDFKGQARAALQCLKAQVEAGGGTMADIVKVNTYLTDI